MKIKRLKVTNFRNIVNKEIDVNETTVIEGKNGIGKSNLLNAVSWFITEKLLTDKWGTGENDIKSIIPTNNNQGDTPMVTMTFDNGVTLTKELNIKYGNNGKFTTTVVGYENGVESETKQEWLKTMLEYFNYSPCLTVVDELRLFTDPLYALQKLEPQDLRTLLIALGCKVTNDDIYRLGFEDLRVHETGEYMGNYTKMRTALKKKLKEFKDDNKVNEKNLKMYNDVHEWNSDFLEMLQDEQQAAAEKLALLKNDDNQALVKNIDLEIKQKQSEIDLANKEWLADIDNQILKAKISLSMAETDVISKKREATKDIESQIKSNDKEIENLQKLLGTYKISKDSIYKSLEKVSSNAGALNDRKAAVIRQIETNDKSEFKGFVTCPCCNHTFAANPEEQSNWIANKQATDRALNKELQSIQDSLAEAMKDFTDLKSKYQAAKSEYESIKLKISDIESQQLDLRVELGKVETNVLGFEKDLQPLQAKISELEKIKHDTVPDKVVELTKELVALKDKRQSILTNSSDANKDQILEVQMLLNDLKDKIAYENIMSSKWATKKDIIAHINENMKQQNDIEHLLSRVNEFIQTMISEINTKAYLKTGIHFTMIEENQTNDGVTEVCYATVDGVPFKDVNTSQKIEIGVQFIEKIKDILHQDFGVEYNDLPILVDRCECFDTVDKVKNLTKQQLICTKVKVQED